MKILVVDDEKGIRKLLCDFLENEGYEIFEASNGLEAINKFESINPDLIILDIMMPELNGIDTLKMIRIKSNVPVIMLTAKTEEGDEIEGLEVGANDYISKPFKPSILIARVKNQLREKEENTIIFENMIIDKLSRIVKIDGEEVFFTLKEYELLSLFLQNIDTAISREDIVSKVWKKEIDSENRTIDTHIKQLRSKIMKSHLNIITIRGFGFMGQRNV